MILKDDLDMKLPHFLVVTTLVGMLASFFLIPFTIKQLPSISFVLSCFVFSIIVDPSVSTRMVVSEDPSLVLKLSFVRDFLSPSVGVLLSAILMKE